MRCTPLRARPEEASDCSTYCHMESVILNFELLHIVYSVPESLSWLSTFGGENRGSGTASDEKHHFDHPDSLVW